MDSNTPNTFTFNATTHFSLPDGFPVGVLYGTLTASLGIPVTVLISNINYISQNNNKINYLSKSKSNTNFV